MTAVVLALKNIFARRSSIFIILFMTFAASLLCVTNAIFDSTEHGVGETFIHSFTGNFMIRPITEMQTSLFGDETPVTGDLTQLANVVPFDDVCKFLEQNKSVKSFVPQLTGFARVESRSSKKNLVLFGTTGDKYINAMSSIHVVEGEPYAAGEKGMMLSKKLAKSMKVKIGDEMQFAVADDMTFRIRAARVAAIYDYEIQNDFFERFVLVDPNTFRSLFDLSDAEADGMTVTDEQANLLSDDLNLDELFGSTEDFSVEEFWQTETDTSFTEETASETKSKTETSAETESANLDLEIEPDGTIWNFIICHTENEKFDKRTILKINKTFTKKGWPVEAVSWRHAAGGSSLYLYWLRVIFNVGILIVLAAGFIVINNTLVINVLDRTKEIGTMRALGAARFFVCLECMAETFLMAMAAAVLGSLVGTFVTFLITKAYIVFTNDFLIQLFGGQALVVKVSQENVRNIFLFMFALGILGWIYPVQTAVKVSPLEAMTGNK